MSSTNDSAVNEPLQDAQCRKYVSRRHESCGTTPLAEK
eukprot:IDg13308t1